MKHREVDDLIHKLEMLEAEEIEVSGNKVEALLYNKPITVRDGSMENPFRALCLYIEGTQWSMKIKHWEVGEQFKVELKEDE